MLLLNIAKAEKILSYAWIVFYKLILMWIQWRKKLFYDGGGEGWGGGGVGLSQKIGYNG